MNRTKAERRERRRNADKRRIRKHGKTLGKVYQDAILKRAKHDYSPICEHCVLEHSS